MLFDLKTVTHVSGPNRHLSRRLHNWQAAGWPVELRGADPNPMENKGHGEEGGVVCLVSGDGKKPGRDEARTTEGQRRRKARTGEGHGPEKGTDRRTARTEQRWGWPVALRIANGPPPTVFN